MVRSASASPSGMETSTIQSVPPLASASASVIMRRGTGLMAGSPGGMGRPGRVTVPTPGPARKVMPLSGAPGETVTRMSAPWVTSGSSPASLTMAAMAAFGSRSVSASAKSAEPPPGRRIVTGSGNWPVSQPSAAARAAAAAQAPVVQPRRRGGVSTSRKLVGQQRQVTAGDQS